MSKSDELDWRTPPFTHTETHDLVNELFAALRESEQAFKKANDFVAMSILDVQRLRAERDRLRAAIKAAPHGEAHNDASQSTECTALIVDDNQQCDCWKRKALMDETEGEGG